MERERKIKREQKRAKEREKMRGPVSPRFPRSFACALFFACAPLSERLEQASNRLILAIKLSGEETNKYPCFIQDNQPVCESRVKLGDLDFDIVTYTSPFAPWGRGRVLLYMPYTGMCC